MIKLLYHWLMASICFRFAKNNRTMLDRAFYHMRRMK